MRFALDVAPLGDLADPAAIVELARVAERAGWDGLSVWDSLGVDVGAPAADPFVALAAVADATERLALIAAVIVLPRRRPQLVAQAAGTLDRLSGGRLVLGVGAGGDKGDFTRFGEAQALADRVPRLDEAVDLVDRLLRGETVSHDGAAFTIDAAAVGPRPVQEPRPPIWLGAYRPGGIRRAARWDGWIAVSIAEDAVSLGMPPDALAGNIALARAERERLGLAGSPFDIAVFGHAGLGGFRPSDYEAAGATWWLENVSLLRGPFEELRAIAAAGPPR